MLTFENKTYSALLKRVFACLSQLATVFSYSESVNESFELALRIPKKSCMFLFIIMYVYM